MNLAGHGGGWQVPTARLPTIVTSEVNGMPFAVPLEPVHSVITAASTTLPSAAVIQAAAAALLRADISTLRPRLPPPQLALQPGSLEQTIFQIDNHVFAHSARPHSSIPSAVQLQGQQLQAEDQQQRPATGKTARQLPPAEKQASAPKRRKRAVATDEEYVARSVNVQQLAADVAESVSSFLSKAAALQEAHSTDTDEDEDDTQGQQQQQRASAGAGGKNAAAAASRKRQLSQPFLSLDMLKELQASLSSGKQAGVISQLDEEQLRQLLLLLLGHVQLGENKLLDEQEAANSGNSKAVTVSLEAACCCLQLLAAPNLPNSLYMDEVITAAVQLAKYHLLYNVLAFYDPQSKRLYRPSSAQDGQATSSKKKARAESAGRVPRIVGDVRSKLELLLSLLAQVVDRVLLEPELLLPLVSKSLTCLSVECLQLLQTEAVALSVAVFRSYPQQRSAILDDVLSTVVTNISLVGAKGPPRLYEATDAAQRPLPIQVATALIMQLVQASVQLPAMDADASTIQGAFKGAMVYSDFFWRGMFARLPAAKAAKSDGAADFKAVMESILADLLAVQMLPEWPAANFLLRWFLKILSSDQGLKHADSAVRLASVEFTGLLAARLCSEALQAEQESEAVQAVLEAAADSAVPNEANRSEQVLNALLLDYLAAAPGSSSSSTGSSTTAVRRFMCCRMLNEVLVRKRQPQMQPTKEELSLLLVQHRQLQDSLQPVLGPSLAELQLTRGQYVALVRRDAMLSGPLGPARGALIKWLVAAGSRHGPDPNPATVRTKVFKCLGTVVEADSRTLGLADVAAAVRAALEDDSVAVREATLELLAKYIGTNPKLAVEYFDVLVTASHDPGVSVRKRAVRSLWECCTCPGFSRTADAVVAILQRAGDTEESMRTLVTKICAEMWFSEGSSFAGLQDDGPNTSSTAAANSRVRTPAVRARELAEVALVVYESGGKIIHVPLAPDHLLVVMLKEVLGSSSSAAATGAAAKEHAALRAGAMEVAEALLDGVLQQQEQSEDGAGPSSTSSGQFPYLLALHALCAADASLATPKADPQRFVRCLAPYISAAGVQHGILARTQSGMSPEAKAAAEDASRRTTEECLCLLAVLRALLLTLKAVEQEVQQQMVNDVVTLINKNRYLQLVAAGCELLCTMACFYPAVIAHISKLIHTCYELAALMLSDQQQQQQTPKVSLQMGMTQKVLYVIGQLCRHGAAFVDAGAADNPSMRSCTECLQLCVTLWYSPELPNTSAGQRVRDAALQALGMIVIGKPGLMLHKMQLAEAATTAAADGANAVAMNRVSDRGSPNYDAGPAAAASGDAAADVSNDGAAVQDSGDDTSAAAVAYGQQAAAAPAAVCPADVYASTLAGRNYSMGVKSRVLTNLVELLRSEESALEARQAEEATANAASRLASTKPSEARAPLATVNGQTDTALGSSIVQHVWKDVVRLATGVQSAARPAAAATPGGGAAAVVEAANMRRRALDVVEVVLRCGLMGPWDAAAPLVALITDEVPETRTAALKVLQFACTKYPDYIFNLLAPAVSAAYQFQSSLWTARHPGQPLPKAPKPEVLEGLASLYQQIVFPNNDGRKRFLSKLLKPFGSACSLADAESASGEDAHKLAFLAYVAACLPFKRGDEPLLLIHCINSHVSRHAHEVLDCLRKQLLQRGFRTQLALEDDVDADDDGAAAAADFAVTAAKLQPGTDAAAQHHDQLSSAQQQRHKQQLNGKPGLGLLQLPFSVNLLAPLKASLALSMLLVLKQYLMAAYQLSDDKVASFELKGERYTAEKKVLISKAKNMQDFGLEVVNLRALDDATGDLLCEQFKTYRALLDNDAANYKGPAVLAALQDHEDEDSLHVGETPAVISAKPGSTAGHAGLVVYSIQDTKKASKVKAGRAAASTGGKRGTAASTVGKRGSRGGASARGKGRGGSTARSKGRKRRRAASEDDTDYDDDDEWVEGAVPKKELF